MTIRDIASVTKESQICMIFGIGVLYKTLFSTNVSYIKLAPQQPHLLMDIKELVPLPYIFS